MDSIPQIDINEFFYDLPQARIAQFPLERRDDSKLLIYQQDKISEDQFKNLSAHLPEDSVMVYNETRVVQARLEFIKDTGARIEIFCLEPVKPTREIQQAFELQSGVTWKCLVGNSKKWKSGPLSHSFKIDGQDCNLRAYRVNKEEEYSLVEFRWDPPNLNFSLILQQAGIMPLPPYMKRASEDADKLRYQTIYARQEGSVAAPTAGLHFTKSVFSGLDKKRIKRHEVTLHVGAGTFKPLTSEKVAGHEMHIEEVHITLETLEELYSKNNRDLIAIGTTTLRTLESIYWYGVKLLVDKNPPENLDVRQWDPYQSRYDQNIPVKEAIGAIIRKMKNQKSRVLTGHTRLMIVPGYQVKTANILITNFHMPKSTLLLLVSAFIGEGWKKVYQYALNQNFRFLSYGDSCLFFKKEV